jgi:hypothetical protein
MWRADRGLRQVRGGRRGRSRDAAGAAHAGAAVRALVVELPPAGSGVEKAMTALMTAGVRARQAFMRC